MTSFYFTITTITTVGYGDISGGTSAEKIGAILLMLLGVISFSFASASLASIFSEFDNKGVTFKDKMAMLNRLQAEYDLPLKLCSNIVKNLSSSFEKQKDEKAEFVEDLPPGLRNELCVHMYKEIYKHISFVKSKSIEFISWICPLLQLSIKMKDEFIYSEE